MARKPQDIDTELQSLATRAKALKAKRVVQLGELIVATGTDTLDPDVLAGLLLHGGIEARTEKTREGYRSNGAAFFQTRGTRKTKDAAAPSGEKSETGGGDDPAR